ncbi:MAG: glycoside hydrolase family 9 protein [Bacteroidota bacterium]|nr:glycoside hydrolase family 9 protein [Bacteroidota bacterium]
MFKRIVLIFLSTFCISMFTYGIDAWIRINQLGYLPASQKKAILLSEAVQSIKQFSIHDALTNQELGTFSTVTSFGEFQTFKSTYILDFSSFKQQGAFYIKAGLIYSPTIFINKNVYLGTADFLLNYINQQRCVYSSTQDAVSHQSDGYEESGEEIIQKTKEPEKRSVLSVSSSAISKSSSLKSSKKSIPVEIQEVKQPKYVDVRGGWHNASDNIQYGSTSANTIFQLLFAYQMNPASFADKHDATGKGQPNGIPDILDEAKWGLDWLVKMYPEKGVLYHQVYDDRSLELCQVPPGRKTVDGWETYTGQPVYIATGRPQGLFQYKNHSTGIASIAGKYASAFGLGAELLQKFYPAFADSLTKKAIEAYQLGQKNPGVCQAVPGKLPCLYEEDNWVDDMELAAAQLYRLTYDGNYLKEAAAYGRMEPVTPWLCSDTARHYQWYPFINLGHCMLANVENPRYQKEFLENMLNGIQRISLRANDNPFKVGVPLIQCSNELVAALATQCRLYRTMTNDSTYLDMETGLVDWLLGRNPWGITMITGLPKTGNSPTDPHATLLHNKRGSISGGVVNGPVQGSIFNGFTGIHLSKDDIYERFQSDQAVYHNDNADYVTNEPTLDGTASLTYLLSGKQYEGVRDKTTDNNQYTCGGITRTDSNKKQICLVFTGHEFADGYKITRKTLKKLNIRASFFFTGDFYRNSKNKRIIKGLLEDKHYLGGHSDKNLLYCSWQKRDSLLVNKAQFLTDIRDNYKEMEKFGIHKSQTPFYLPPFEWYNDSISQWCKEIGIQLVDFTPGTLSNTDYSTPEMRDKYYSSNEIYNKILQVASKQGLNGNIMLFHIGSDARRQDKFYPRLYSLLVELSKAGYDFVDLYQATDIVDKNVVLSTKKQKRKN